MYIDSNILKEAIKKLEITFEHPADLCDYLSHYEPIEIREYTTYLRELCRKMNRLLKYKNQEGKPVIGNACQKISFEHSIDEKDCHCVCVGIDEMLRGYQTWYRFKKNVPLHKIESIVDLEHFLKKIYREAQVADYDCF